MIVCAACVSYSMCVLCVKVCAGAHVWLSVYASTYAYGLQVRPLLDGHRLILDGIPIYTRRILGHIHTEHVLFKLFPNTIAWFLLAMIHIHIGLDSSTPGTLHSTEFSAFTLHQSVSEYTSIGPETTSVQPWERLGDPSPGYGTQHSHNISQVVPSVQLEP